MSLDPWYSRLCLLLSVYIPFHLCPTFIFWVLLPSFKIGIENRKLIYSTICSSQKERQLFLIVVNEIQQQHGHRLWLFSKEISSWISTMWGDFENEPLIRLELQSHGLTGEVSLCRNIWIRLSRCFSAAWQTRLSFFVCPTLYEKKEKKNFGNMMLGELIICREVWVTAKCKLCGKHDTDVFIHFD